MKILLCALRHWTAGRRFRSLLLNAPKEGHEVFGLPMDSLADHDLTIAAFNELGAEGFPKEAWEKTLERLNWFNPDVVFAVLIFRTALDRRIQEWVNSHNKISLVVGHEPYILKYTHDAHQPEWTRTYVLVSSQQQADARATCYKGEEAIGNWPRERIFVLGAPDLDFVTESVDTAGVRDRLGLAPNQPLVGLFPTTAEDCNHEELTTLVDECQDAGYQVVIHVHPNERRAQNSEARPVTHDPAPALNWDGFHVYDRHRIAAQLWPKIQAMGARFIADYAPGRICGVEFHRCQSFELMQAADCLIGSFDPFFEAHALKKGYVLLSSEAPHLLKGAPYKDIYQPEFELQDNFTKISKVLERGNELEQDPAFVEKWFFKLDGLWWKRALDLAGQLIKNNP